MQFQSRYHYIGIVYVLFLFSVQSFAQPKGVIYKQGVVHDTAMVVSAHPMASKVGVDILKKGGNAIDAAVAVQMTLAVVLPIAGNIGGGGFMVFRDKKGDVMCLDFREKAPISAHKDMYLDSNGNVIKNLSLDGALAVGVPGTVDGCVKMHSKHGLLNWEELIQPSIDLANQGFKLTEYQAQYLNKTQEKFNSINKIETSFQKENWVEGDLLIQTELAQSLIRIRDAKRAGFYEGETANLIVKCMMQNDGFINFKDLENYESIWRKPVKNNYKNYTVFSMPPPSSGGIALLQLLMMSKIYPLQSWGFQSIESIHHMVEFERRVYADRASYLGDPDFVNVPDLALLDKQYNVNRAKNIKNKASNSEEISGGLSYKESDETTHFSIVDQWGNAVAITTTLNGAYGSKLVVPGAGFLLNNEMDDFSIKPGVPNQYGLVGNKANAIHSGKRMLSSMTPTILEKNGKLFMVIGTPGGSTIITSVYQCILNVIEFNMDMAGSVNAGRFHHQWKPDLVYIEDGILSKKQRRKLKRKGHHLKVRKPIGKVDAILINDNGKIEGAADPRADSKAIGY